MAGKSGFDRVLSDTDWVRLISSMGKGSFTTRWEGVLRLEFERVRARWQRYRDLLAVMLMGEAGLRVGEVVRLEWRDVLFGNKARAELVVRSEIAKGGRERTIPLGRRVGECIRALWGEASLLPGFNIEKQVVCDRSGRFPLSVRQMERRVKKWGGVLLGKRVVPHMLRHTFATRLLGVVDIRTVQECLGHGSVRTTEIYTHVDQRRKRAAVEGLADLEKDDES